MIGDALATVDDYIRVRCDLRSDGHVERLQDHCRRLAISLPVSCHPYD